MNIYIATVSSSRFPRAFFKNKKIHAQYYLFGKFQNYQTMLAVVTIARKTTHKRNCKNSHRGCTSVGSATMGTLQITINLKYLILNSIYQYVDTAFEI